MGFPHHPVPRRSWQDGHALVKIISSLFLALNSSVFRLVVQDRMGRWTFFGGWGWCCGSARPPWDCGVATKTKGQYCCFAVWTLDCRAFQLLTVFWTFCTASARFPSTAPISSSSSSCFPYGWREEVEPKCAMSATCFCPSPLRSSLRPFSFDFAPILLRRVHLSALLPLRECNTVGPQPNDLIL